MKKIILIYFLLFSSIISFAQDKEKEQPKGPSLFSQVIDCKSRTNKLMENIRDNVREQNIISLLNTIKQENQACLNKIAQLKLLADTTDFKDELLNSLTYTEKRLIIDTKIIETVLNSEARPSDIENANKIAAFSRNIRQNENNYWKKLEETLRVSQNGENKEEEGGEAIFWIFLILGISLIYFWRNYKKAIKNKDLDIKNNKNRPLYKKINKFVAKIEKKADEIRKEKADKFNNKKKEEEEGN